jgi:hypothetical protein
MVILYLKIQCGISQIWCYQIYLVIPTTRRFPDAPSLTDIGHELLAKLQEIYRKIDDEATVKDAHLQCLRSLPSTVEPASFYQGLSTKPSVRRTPRAIISDDESAPVSRMDNKYGSHRGYVRAK